MERTGHILRSLMMTNALDGHNQRRVEMTTTTVTTQSWNAAVKKQFPWISTKGLTARVQISRVSPELLEVIPSEEYGTDLSGFFTNDKVEFHAEDGTVLGRVSPAMSHADANDMSSDSDGETIGDAWARLKSPELVRCLSRYTYYSSGLLSADPNFSVLEIYKVSSFDIRAWIKARSAVAERAVASFYVPTYKHSIYWDSPGTDEPYQWCSKYGDASRIEDLLERLADGESVRVTGPVHGDQGGPTVDLIVSARPTTSDDKPLDYAVHES